MRVKTSKPCRVSQTGVFFGLPLFIMFLFLLTLPVSAQQANEQMDITGDVMYLNEDGTRVVEGHLVIKREDMTLWADRGTYNEKKNFSSATGHVIVEMENTNLTCGYLEFYMNENRSVARIQPKIVQKIPEKKVEDESSESKLEDGELEKKATEKKNKTKSTNTKTGVLVGREIEIYHDENRVKAVGRAILTQYSTSGKKSRKAKRKGSSISKDGDLKITAHSIELYTDINRMVALRNVKIVNSDITAAGNKAIYNDKTEVLDIIGNAKTWQKANIDIPDAKKKEDKKAKKKDGNEKKAPKKSELLVKGEKELERVKKIKKEMVHINDLDGGHAEAERAVYNARDEVLDLIGSAKSWQEDGINLAQGERIRYFLKDKRSVLIDARIKHYPGGSGLSGSKKSSSVKNKSGNKKKNQSNKKSAKSEEEAALEALRMLE